MKRTLGFVLLVLMLAPPQAAPAQRGRGRGRDGPAMSVGGPVFNPTQTPEWRQAGGNIEVYEQLMMQKQYQAEQKQYQAMLHQRQAHQKWLKGQAARKAKGQPVDPAYTQMLAQEELLRKQQEEQAAKLAAKKARAKRPTKAKAKTPTSATAAPKS